jgi:hypothetical protein
MKWESNFVFFKMYKSEEKGVLPLEPATPEISLNLAKL